MFEEINGLKNISDILSLIESYIPEGTNEEQISDNVKVTLSKKDGKVSLNIETVDEDEIEDEALIKDYLELVTELDDDVFIEMTEKLGEEIDINKFNELIEKDKLTEEEGNEVALDINVSLDILDNILKERISKYTEIVNRIAED